MIKGAVNDRYEAEITITILTSTGGTRDIETVVDTGYNGFLLLPTELVGDLQLPFLNSTVAVLANDEAVTLHTHQAEIVWDGQTRTVRATASGSTPLAGMRLMAGHHLSIDVRENGPVQIENNTEHRQAP